MPKDERKKIAIALALRKQKKTVVAAAAELIANKEIDWAARARGYHRREVLAYVLLGLSVIINILQAVL